MIKTFAALLILAPAAFAQDALLWRLNPGKSSIAWEAVQNGAPVKGGFETFEATIRFHPDALGDSQAEIQVMTSTIFTSYDEAQTTLKTKDWFFAEQFPVATFKTQSFTALPEENHFRADATLTIKDKTVPVTLDFLMHHMNEHEAHIIGETTLRRTDFGIGWADTSQIEDEVKVIVEIKANR